MFVKSSFGANKNEEKLLERLLKAKETKELKEEAKIGNNGTILTDNFC